MSDDQAQEIIDKIVSKVFGYQNPFTLEQFHQKFAFDIRLPQPVVDATDGTTTWASSTNPTKFVRIDKARALSDATDGLVPTRQLGGVADILAVWNEVNYTTSERQIDSLQVTKSDDIRKSERVYHSQNIEESNGIVFCDGVGTSEMMAACQRSGMSNYSIRVDDSNTVTNSFNVSWCAKITNCFFMHDCSDMSDSMFCSNISGKRFCIANMQYDESEYARLREDVVRWILSQ